MFATACGGGEDGDGDGGGNSADGGVPDNGPLEILSFTATRQTIQPFEGVELEWSVRGARVVDISSADGTLVSTFDQSGRVATRDLRETTVYTLTIERGAEMKSATLEIVVDWPEPEIFSFIVTPQVAQANSFVSLQWSARSASYLRLLKNGVEALRITTNLENGFLTQLIEEGTTIFTLEAINPEHTETQSVTVEGVVPPVITKFNIQPRVIFPDTRTATVTWSTTSATHTQLWDVFARPVVGFPGTTSGTVSIAIRSAEIMDYRLTAFGTDFTTEGYRRIGPPTAEIEPNDDARFANSLWDVGGATGTLSFPGDVDVYAVFPTGGASLRVRVTGANGRGCETDTRIELQSFSSGTLAADSDSGEATGRGGFCGLIDPAVRIQARDLFEGQYLIFVSGSESGDYVLLTDEE